MQTVLPSDEHLKQKLFHKETVLISEDKKYPELFRWKTATLIISAIAAILLMILLVVIYSIESQQQIVTNLTFLSSITQQTTILTTKTQLLNLAYNFQSIFGRTKFHSAQLLYQGKNLTTTILRNDIYSNQNEKIIYLLELELTLNSTNTIQYPMRVAVFMNSPFPVPEGEEFNDKLDYYSFEIKDQRKSSLLSLNSNNSLKLYATHSQIKSVSECQNYLFQPENNQRTGSFSLLNDLVWFDLGSQTVEISASGWKCFSPQFTSEQDMQRTLSVIFHPNYNHSTAQITLNKIEVYYLS